MSGWLSSGDRVARAVVAPALGLMFSLAPRMGRGARPMPIDASVQEHATVPLEATRPEPTRSESLHPATHVA